MSKLIFKIALPLSIISFVIVTKWWYVLPVDAPDEIMMGFPFPYLCNAWRASMTYQIFVAEFIFDFFAYFLFWLFIIYMINRRLIPIKIYKSVTITLWVFSGFIVIMLSLIASTPENIFYLRRPFDIEVMETHVKFLWDKEIRPDFDKYRTQYKINPECRYPHFYDKWIITNDSLDKYTIEDLGEFLTDENKVYSKFDCSDGVRIIEVAGADRKSFESLGHSIYGRDKFKVYDSRHGAIPEADVKTFRAVNIVTKDRIAYGKDKDNYFFWDEIVTDTIGFGKILKEQK